METIQARRIFRQTRDDNGNPIAGEFDFNIDNSSLEYFNGCARSAEFYMVRSRGGGTAPALDYGGAIHAYLEHRLNGWGKDKSCQAMVEMFKTFPPMPEDEWRTVDHAINAMHQYELFYDQQPKRLTVQTDFDERPMVEVPFRIPLTTVEVDDYIQFPANLLVEGWNLLDQNLAVTKIHVYWTGKIDAIVSYDGAPAVMDHKTTSMIGSTFFKDFELAQQVIGYVWASRRLPAPLVRHEKMTRFLLDAIVGRKPSRTGIAHEFHRQVYTYTEEQISDWEENTKHLVADFLSHLLRGFFPMQTRWCVGKYGLCKYHEVCTMPKEFRLQHLQNAYPPVTWSPLK